MGNSAGRYRRDEAGGGAVGTRRDRRLAERARRRRRRLLFTLGAVAVALGLVLLGNIGWFYVRSHVEGGRLVGQETQAIARAHQRAATTGSTAAVCPQLTDTSPAPQGLLEATAIGLTAPVMGGVTDAQLNVAVGHVPGSAWPGQPGTSILAAHDVSYFSGLTGLHPGDRIDFVTPCATDVYRVTGHQIVTSGTPIYSNPSQALLVLETCYPTDALFLTNKRYLLTATSVTTTAHGTALPASAGTGTSAPSVPVPAALGAQGLTLATNSAPMGVEHFTGTPTPRWRQSAAPFADETAALTAYFGAVHAAEQGQSSWWTALAPTVPMTAAAPLETASIAGYAEPLDVTLRATGTTFTGATLDATVTVSGGSHPGTYALSVVATDHGGVLQVTEWTMAGQ